MTRADDPTQEITKAVARLQASILALVFGMMGGLAVFVMTAWLLIKGGENVGLHLNLLGNYFIGYSVTWGGAFVGLIYGAIVGAILGWVIGVIYNRIVGIRKV